MVFLQIGNVGGQVGMVSEQIAVISLGTALYLLIVCDILPQGHHLKVACGRSSKGIFSVKLRIIASAGEIGRFR